MSTMIVCPGCGTEADIRQLDETEKNKCTICGKLLLAEILRMKQDMERDGIKLKNQRSERSVSDTIGRKLKRLGDDDLFGDLDPHDFEDDEEEDDGLFPTAKKERKGSRKEQPDKSFKDDETDDEKKFENPMEKSKLMKHLKDDQDLFGSLDG